MCAPKAPKVEKVPVRQQQRLPDNGDMAATPANVRRQRASAGMMALAATGGFTPPNVTKLGG
ncbi:MAG: hypothetical protein ACRCWJ_15075 [Casimicrobium sp.]